jgi:small multidrug resistance pump
MLSPNIYVTPGAGATKCRFCNRRVRIGGNMPVGARQAGSFPTNLLFAGGLDSPTLAASYAQTKTHGKGDAAVAYLYLAIAIISEVVATTALKASHGFTRPMPSALVVAGYAVAFYCLSLCLHSMQVGVVYAIWSGIGIVLVTLVAAVVYRQVPDLWACVGITLIIAGVAVLQLLSKSAAH